MLVVYSVLIGYILRLLYSQMWMIWLFLSANLCHTGRVTESQSHQNPRRNTLGTSLRSWDPHPLVIIHCVVSSSGRVVMMNRCRGGNMEWIYVKINSFGCNINLFYSILWCDLTVLVHHLGTRFNQIHGVPAARQWNVASLRQNVANSSDVAASSEAGSPWFLGWPCVSQGYETSDVLYAHNHS